MSASTSKAQHTHTHTHTFFQTYGCPRPRHCLGTHALGPSVAAAVAFCMIRAWEPTYIRYIRESPVSDELSRWWLAPFPAFHHPQAACGSLQQATVGYQTRIRRFDAFSSSHETTVVGSTGGVVPGAKITFFSWPRLVVARFFPSSTHLLLRSLRHFDNHPSPQHQIVHATPSYNLQLSIKSRWCLLIQRKRSNGFESISTASSSFLWSTASASTTRMNAPREDLLHAR